jgi:formamidopyrimidine-DNA glycosylase
MPELPEVQTVLETLRPRLTGLRIERVDVRLEKIVKSPGPQQFAAQVHGRAIAGLKRLGKYLLLELEGGLLLVVHLGMTGRLIYTSAGEPSAGAPTVMQNGASAGAPTVTPTGASAGAPTVTPTGAPTGVPPSGAPPSGAPAGAPPSGESTEARTDTPWDRHTHLVFYLSDGAELRYHDQRQFGAMDLMPVDRWEAFCSQKKLGPDALDPSLSCGLFQERMERRKGPIKKLLLDQSLVAGIGNIYANEILWQARVHPERAASSLDRQEVRRIHRAMRTVLSEAITHRGTTLRDYVDGEGHPGGFQERLAVHGREGRPCPRCGTAIVRLKVGGRSSFACPCCQH